MKKIIKKEAKKAEKPKVKLVKKPKKEVKSKPFGLTLFLNGKEYRGEGETFEEALSQIQPKGVRMSGCFELFYDGKKAKTTLPVVYMRKLFLFRQKLIAKFLLRRLTLGLK